MEESTSRQYILEAMMASLTERNMETEGAGSDVSAKAHRDACLHEAAGRSDAGGQIKVGFRAVGHPDSVFFHPLYLFRAGVDAVSHDGLALRAESAEVIVGIP